MEGHPEFAELVRQVVPARPRKPHPHIRADSRVRLPVRMGARDRVGHAPAAARAHLRQRRWLQLLKDYDLTGKKIFLFHEPHYSIEAMLVEACSNLGFKKENIILSGQQKNNQEVLECDIYYCTEGNTFEVLSILRERGLDSVIKEGFKKDGKIYIGCSAGAAIAGVSIEGVKDFDRNFVVNDGLTGHFRANLTPF